MQRNFGFIREKIEIKILILYIMRRIAGPVMFETLAELTMCDDGVSYFDYADCVMELVKTEHLMLADNKYTITAKGIRDGETTETSLPLTVRQYAANAADAVRMTQNRNTMITTSHSSEPNGGCKVNLALSDGVGDLINMELFAANEKLAKSLEKGFRKKAESVYHALIEMITNK